MKSNEESAEKKPQTQDALDADKSLNKKFNSLLKSAEAPKVKKAAKTEKRGRGRPKSGKVIFKQRCIDSLPKFGNISEIARILGIKHTTLQQWCALDHHPLPFVQKDDHKVFRKDVLVRWLAATNRFKIKPEYGIEE